MRSAEVEVIGMDAVGLERESRERGSGCSDFKLSIIVLAGGWARNLGTRICTPDSR